MIRHDENSTFDVDSASYLVAVMLHDCIRYDTNMALLWWMGVDKVDINLLVLLEALLANTSI